MTTDPKPAEPREPVTVKSPKGPFDSSAIVVDTSGSLEHLAVLLHERFRPLAGDVLIFDDCEQIAQMAVVALKHDERAAYDRGLAEGRRQATEGWEREWALKRSGSLGAYGFRNEAAARQAADRNPELALLSRLVGPWEPAEQTEAAPGCPTCSGPIRETVGMVCQTCGTDYASGGVVEPPQFAEPEYGCTLTIPPRPSDPALAETVDAAYGVTSGRSGIVRIEPSGPLTAEVAAPVVSIEPDPMLHGHLDGSSLDHGCPECQLKLAAVAARVRAAHGMPAEEARPIDGIKVISNRPRMTDGCGPEHTYRGTCEYAHWAKED